jgi:hypothetical protein
MIAHEKSRWNRNCIETAQKAPQMKRSSDVPANFPICRISGPVGCQGRDRLQPRHRLFPIQDYSWLKVEAGDPLWPDRIMAAVDEQFTPKGWSRRRGEAMLPLRLSAPRINSQGWKPFMRASAGGRRWRGFGDGMAVTNVENITIGTLVIDIFDFPTKALIWRGIASDALSDKPGKNEKKLVKGVEEGSSISRQSLRAKLLLRPVFVPTRREQRGIVPSPCLSPRCAQDSQPSRWLRAAGIERLVYGMA